ncbi:hypothetical protein UFOVP398_35 [uncultured Caudovirales phage]|uniref:Uncharacterized protein n=1 Tax=uncultured Caudovirales phage TaxID=2100421 RepID=A0A6J5M2K0_9CAUD|nr:hypothetical protein UFOVP398_35 [uncultured Caudovirales phage]
MITLTALLRRECIAYTVAPKPLGGFTIHSWDENFVMTWADGHVHTDDSGDVELRLIGHHHGWEVYDAPHSEIVVTAGKGYVQVTIDAPEGTTLTDAKEVR